MCTQIWSIPEEMQVNVNLGRKSPKNHKSWSLIQEKAIDHTQSKCHPTSFRFASRKLKTGAVQELLYFVDQLMYSSNIYYIKKNKQHTDSYKLLQCLVINTLLTSKKNLSFEVLQFLRRKLWLKYFTAHTLYLRWNV